MQNAEQKTALIAMSGGVDSSIAAYLMRQADFRCMGTTMRLYRNEDLGACNFRTCCSEKDIEDASEVAFQLDIPYEVLDFTLDFQEKIIGKFVRTYEAGGTPNPCIDCNRFMKFDKLLDFAEQHGLYYVVTGHYARIEQDEQTGRWLLKKGVDAGKDQSYVLYTMTQRQLAHTKFPLGDRNKPEIRELAEQLSFCNARKHDSQDICLCRTAITSSSWSSTRASTIRQAISSIWTASRWESTRVLSAIPSARDAASVLRWVSRCMSAARIWRRTRFRSDRRRRCSRTL